MHTDHRLEARALLEELQPLIEHTQSAVDSNGHAIRTGALADDAEADRSFEEALAADMTLWPFQRGRLLLAHGAWLRRRRRVSEARSPLRSARDTFDALGAIQWAERARQELRATGETSRGREVEAWTSSQPRRSRLPPWRRKVCRIARLLGSCTCHTVR